DIPAAGNHAAPGLCGRARPLRTPAGIARSGPVVETRPGFRAARARSVVAAPSPCACAGDIETPGCPARDRRWGFAADHTSQPRCPRLAPRERCVEAARESASPPCQDRG